VSGATFSFELPKERIASWPAGKTGARSAAKLLHCITATREVFDRTVEALPEILKSGDVLVLNQTKVIPARFRFTLHGKAVELFLLKQLSTEAMPVWEALGNPLHVLAQQQSLKISSSIEADVLRRTSDNTLEVELRSLSEHSVAELIEREGQTPIPPYIRGGESTELDRMLYQTVFAKESGSIAAPTAGLHFTEALLSRLKEKGVEPCFLTLHVGRHSIQNPSKVSEVGKEYFSISKKVWSKCLRTRETGSRVVAVGTTSVRALESRARGLNNCETELVIAPGFQFQVVDLLFTNTHQPGSTHLALVEAFCGKDALKKSYLHALANDYRFLSYGDAMLFEKSKHA